jgi:uncharacterized membrane protein YccC
VQQDGRSDRSEEWDLNRSLKVMSLLNQTFSVRMGTICGTITVILCNITAGEIIRIAVSAALGTAVSFTISWLLKKIMKDRPRS